MNSNFFSLSIGSQQEVIVAAEDKLNIKAAIIEKDLWLCWLLKELFQLPIPMAFKGGTSLSKVFALINRFSEDVDITIDYRYFIDNLDLKNASRSNIKKISTHLTEQLKICVAKNILPALHKALLAQMPFIKDFDFQLNDGGDCLHFYYPTISHYNYLKEHVLIEFGVRNSTEPNLRRIITTLLSKVEIENLILPEATLTVLSPIRTFWEKVTLIHVECNRSSFGFGPERLSRHWYDLAALANSWVLKEALAAHDVFASVVQHKMTFFNASYAHYEDCLSGKLRLLPERDGLKALSQDFKNMKKAGMFQESFEKQPEFAEILQTLKNLEEQINSYIK